MGTDRVRFFDKGVADRVLAMDREALEALLAPSPSNHRAPYFLDF